MNNQVLDLKLELQEIQQIQDLNPQKSQESIQYKEKRSFIKRTFGPLTPGGVRGNIFLLIMTTIGASFFLIPNSAKRSGLGTALCFLVISGVVSYFCCMILYKGQAHTKSVTYNECMERVVGPKFGFLSGCAVFLHICGAALTTLVFSFRFLSNGIIQIFQLKIEQEDPKIIYPFFALAFLIIYFVTLFKSIEKLKIVSLVGILLLIYLVTVFGILTPQYFKYYTNQKEIEERLDIIWFKKTSYVFKTWGIISYMFLNQYTIMPICSNTVRASKSRMSKIFYRGLLMIFMFYCLILTEGYLSQPNVMKEKIFLLRKAIVGINDQAIVLGRVFFGLALFIGVILRSYFLLVYLDNLIKKFQIAFIYSEERAKEILQEAQEQDKLEEEKKKEKRVNCVDKIRQNIAWSRGEAIRNFLYLIFHISISFLFRNQLERVIGFIGGFVGVFEIIIIPGIMFVVLNHQVKFMSNLKEGFFILAICVLTPVYCAGAFFSIYLE